MFGGGKNNMAQLMQKAKKMQDDLMKAHAELENIHVEGQAGAGLVKVTITCKYKIVNLFIDPVLFKDGDEDTIKDLTIGAFHDAFKKIEEKTQAGMGDLKNMLPQGVQFPF